MRGPEKSRRSAGHVPVGKAWVEGVQYLKDGEDSVMRRLS